MSKSTAWESSGKWYNEKVGETGHYYHQSVIIPGVLKLFNLKKEVPASVLDLACGQGVLSRHLPQTASYVGVDASASLIASAKNYKHPSSHRFIQADVTSKLPLENCSFTHAAMLLALQNIEHPLEAFKNANRYLNKGASFVIVINHPCFRIPRQSSWQVDEKNKTQFRRIDRYMTSMKIPIQTHPGKKDQSTQTVSFHHCLSDYSRWLKEAGFVIEVIEEWCSDKVSEGGAAKMENRSRAEIPLFMAIVAKKL